MQWPYPLAALISSLIGTAAQFLPPIIPLQMAGRDPFRHLQILGDTPARMMEWVLWTWAFYFGVMLVAGVPLAKMLKRAGRSSYVVYLLVFYLAFTVLGRLLHPLEGQLELLTRRIDTILTLIFLVTPFYFMVGLSGDPRR